MSLSSRLQTSTVLVTAWLGASLITVAVVAPGAFAVLPSRSMAGTMVGRVLPSLFIAGIAIGVVVALLSGGLASAGAPRWTAVSALLASVACAISQFGITPQLDRLRSAIVGPIEALSPDDPRRVAFGLLHGYNVAGLGVAMLAAAVCLGFLQFSLRPRT
jgi:hypothetical protein